MTRWSGTSRNAVLLWLAAVIGILLLALTVGLWGDDGIPAWVLIMNAALTVLIPIALVIAARLRVDVTDDALVVRWGPSGWPRTVIPWTEVSEVSVVDVDPWQWGGWGGRWAPGGRGTAAIVRRGPGIQVARTGRTPFTVTVDDADAGALAARAALAGRPGQG